MKFTHFAKRIVKVHFGRVPDTKQPVSLRFDPAFHERLQKAADAVGLPKHTLCQSAVMAAVESIEESNFRVVFPIKFSVKEIPKKNPKAK